MYLALRLNIDASDAHVRHSLPIENMGTAQPGVQHATLNMTTRKPSTPRFVLCVDNSEYPASLELHKVYRVVPDADAAYDGDLRVVDESGEDYLYPAAYFAAIDLPRPVVHA
jgi:hypothetical protein